MDGHDGGGGELGVGHGHGVDLGFGHNDFGHSHGNGQDGGHGWTVSAEAMMMAHSYCHEHSGMIGHFSGGMMDGDGMDIGHLGGWSHGESADPNRIERIKRFRSAVERAKLDPARRYYGAHVVGHGYINIPDLFTRFALASGLVRICNTVPNFNPVDLTDVVISDWARFSPPYTRARVPAGYYPNARGNTRVFKQYWQVSEEPCWYSWKQKPKFDRMKSTYIEVSIVTWFYTDILDYETRIDINVVSLPVFDRWDKVWGRRRTPLMQHQTAAEKVVHHLYEALENTPPNEHARKARTSVVKRQAQQARVAEEQRRPHIAKPGQSGADLDSLFGATDPLDGAAPMTGGNTGAGNGSVAVGRGNSVRPVITAPGSALPAAVPASSTPADGDDDGTAFAASPTTIPAPRVRRTD